MEKGHFETAMRIIRTVLQDRINLTAQTALANAVGLRSASLVDQLFLSENDVTRMQSMFHHSSRFNQLDLLGIGQDHVFVIHRELLLQDIYDYLSSSPKGLQRVFVNVDYRLSQPEIIPGNRYKPLEEYIRDTLLPEIKFRIDTWNEAERCNRPLDIPATLSLVTLVGWLSSYPVNYVHPTRLKTERNQDEAASESSLGKESSKASGDMGEDDDDDQDSGRNCLANQLLVLTSVQLEPSETVDGLKDHLMMRFSYPSELAEKFMDRSLLSPESPCSPQQAPSPVVEDRDDVPFRINQGEEDVEEEDDDEDEFVDASDAEFTEPDAEQDADLGQLNTQEIPVSIGGMKPSPLKDSVLATAAVSAVRGHPRRLPSSASYDKDRPLPFNNPDILAAGRSFLHQLHTRFQKQSVWKAWEVGQEKVIFPVVAI
ncbi:hypothetical protein BGX28_002313 [Mortierella sp. GBA30]|nr:hypothetical protein BGX28_002313 [Mortierella sp. GBA30]